MDKKKKRSWVAHDCQYNAGCACQRKECHRCGWNPAVAKLRLDKILKERGV